MTSAATGPVRRVKDRLWETRWFKPPLLTLYTALVLLVVVIAGMLPAARDAEECRESGGRPIPRGAGACFYDEDDR